PRLDNNGTPTGWLGRQLPDANPLAANAVMVPANSNWHEFVLNDNIPCPAEVKSEAAVVTSEDELAAVISEAITDHVAGDALLIEKPPAHSSTHGHIVDSIDQLDETVLHEAATRIQAGSEAGKLTAMGALIKPHRFYDEIDDDDEFNPALDLDEDEDERAETLTAPDDPLDISLLMNSYAQRQHALIGFDWVTIPAGRFLLGSDPQQDIHMFEDELPQLMLYLDTYRISKIPITNAQYKLFMVATDHVAPFHWRDYEIPEGLENHPVVNISWSDAEAFCEWAGVRLPTEAEWEKAARGPSGQIYPWGNELPDATRCNFDLTIGMTVTVGSYPAGASPYGVLDMAGNVWEWTATPWLDTYHNYLVELTKLPQKTLRRVLRGGGFRNIEFVRCAARSWDLPNQHYRDLGFRVVAL
ncbi:MAG: SUMF1/EgtB/PvdO family nonheme iron enzyme, partial [Caldilineaceae bacterium]